MSLQPIVVPLAVDAPNDIPLTSDIVIGPAGPPGPQGPEGPQGPDGASAYDAAVAAGYTGTEAEFNAAMAGLTTAESNAAASAEAAAASAEEAARYAHSTYIHRQYSASATWTITHNLDNYPSVTAVDSSGSVVVGDVAYLDANTLTISFIAPFSGEAYLN